MSASLEFLVPKAESDTFNAAVYRFVELKQPGITDDLMILQSEPFGPVDRKNVTLWSDGALQDFVQFWSVFRRGPIPIGWA
jgi:hypothetical protein